MILAYEQAFDAVEQEDVRVNGKGVRPRRARQHGGEVNAGVRCRRSIDRAVARVERGVLRHAEALDRMAKAVGRRLRCDPLVAADDKVDAVACAVAVKFFLDAAARLVRDDGDFCTAFLEGAKRLECAREKDRVLRHVAVGERAVRLDEGARLLLRALYDLLHGVCHRQADGAPYGVVCHVWIARTPECEMETFEYARFGVCERVVEVEEVEAIVVQASSSFFLFPIIT